MADVTSILSQIQQGDPQAAERLLPLVYNELRRLAARRIAQESPGQTLQATALVHEAYLRLIGPHDQQTYNSRGHFFGAAAEAMRRIIVERARRKRRVKHGGQFERVDLDSACAPVETRPWDVLAIDQALTKLAFEQPVKAELVKLRYFAGLTMPEAADVLGVSLATAERYWTFAKSWLYAELSGGPPKPKSKKPKSG